MLVLTLLTVGSLSPEGRTAIAVVIIGAGVCLAM